MSGKKKVVAGLTSAIAARLSAINTYRATRLKYRKSSGGLSMSFDLFQKALKYRLVQEGQPIKAAEVISQISASRAAGGKTAVKDLKKARKLLAMEAPVRFIRRNGRIIPIRGKKK